MAIKGKKGEHKVYRCRHVACRLRDYTWTSYSGLRRHEKTANYHLECARDGRRRCEQCVDHRNTLKAVVRPHKRRSGPKPNKCPHEECARCFWSQKSARQHAKLPQHAACHERLACHLCLMRLQQHEFRCKQEAQLAPRRPKQKKQQQHEDFDSSDEGAQQQQQQQQHPLSSSSEDLSSVDWSSRDDELSATSEDEECPPVDALAASTLLQQQQQQHERAFDIASLLVGRSNSSSSSNNTTTAAATPFQKQLQHPPSPMAASSSSSVTLTPLRELLRTVQLPSSTSLCAVTKAHYLVRPYEARDLLPPSFMLPNLDVTSVDLRLPPLVRCAF